MKLTSTIGMEVHVELKTKSKMFCGCPNDHFQVKPNSHTCPVCLGLPGALPVPNKKAVDFTGMIALALNCTINKESKFDRKHYFYPDLPKGYQISQYDQPIGVNGSLNLDDGKEIKLTRVHLEEDTGKLIHKKVDGKEASLVDFNRSGVPLVEIVSQPDLSSGLEAKEYLKKIRDILKALKVSDCDMEKGTMRLEVNISLSSGRGLADYKVEIKNLNSFRYVEQAINYEIKRQKEILTKGQTPTQETRGFNSKNKTTFSQRGKEEAEDYRYFPEPDIPPMEFTDKDIATWGRSLPQLPQEKVATVTKTYQLPSKTAQLLVLKPQLLSLFEEKLKLAQKNQLSNLKWANLLLNGKVDSSSDIGKQLEVLTSKALVEERILDKVIADNKEAVAKFKAGKQSIIGFLVGQVMRETKGKVDPNQARKALLAKLESSQ